MVDCAIIGAGMAGLAAGVRLAERGARVAVLEARPRAGGRTWSLDDRAFHGTLDNGQHILMGCYTATLDHLARTGAAHMVERYARFDIPYRHRDGRAHRLSDRGVPWPFGPLVAVLTWRMLSMRERFSAARLLASLRALPASRVDAMDDATIASWLMESGQEDNAIELFWKPIVVATMNARPEECSAAVFVRVLRAMFFSGAAAANIIIPKRGLSEVFVDPAVACIRNNGGEVLARSKVLRIVDRGAHMELAIAGREPLACRKVVCAIPAWSLATVLAESGLRDVCPAPIERFTPGAIASLHLLTDAPLFPAAMTGCLGTDVQWVFGQAPVSGGFHSSCVISAPGPLLAHDRGALLDHAIGEVCMLAGVRESAIIRSRLIIEKRATFTPAPGLDVVRKGAISRHPRIVFAGDWTDTGLPATIESAVRSGLAAAKRVEERVI